MRTLVLRLNPGDDLRASLDSALKQSGDEAAFVVSGIGSLSGASIRFAGAETPAHIEGDLEILTLAGSLSPDGSHLHISVSDSAGRVFGGHAAPGCTVRTTAEILIAVLPDWQFAREHDPLTGHAELSPRRKP
ncbi:MULTISPECIES: PPC domain-containing DNA-binding protein [unclassified Variovorax]|mgnify:CR=1 FL=1|jgi:predicted DNA-binding protein with PD1-like motif|uniref:PPC domain-containing DNA-binding protein n=1 Tax=unclassified Variovorax TaxID=663243 RepID=UPI000F7F3953|nr:MULTISPECIES: PPC domain-containing DNA-binding protein [unclassified Variovorax]RSZ30402.1 DNA-binding protein [Variovorax sp. 553]RSZ30938.1 DNA-binding protein [Variovorax sp. 679]